MSKEDIKSLFKIISKIREEEWPTSICPVCGEADVEITDGKGKCNNNLCQAEMTYGFTQTWTAEESATVGNVGYLNIDLNLGEGIEIDPESLDIDLDFTL